MLNIYEILRITQVEYLPTLDFIGLVVRKKIETLEEIIKCSSRIDNKAYLTLD